MYLRESLPVSNLSMLPFTRRIFFAVLFFSCYGYTAPRCGSAALHDAILTAADAKMDGYVLFRGEVASLPRDANPPPGGCCSGPECISVQCASPTIELTPFLVLDYTVREALWGTIPKPLIKAHHGDSPCGAFHPALHQKVITYCSLPEGATDGGGWWNVWWCERPIADTPGNLRVVRSWVPEALRRQQRVKISEQEASSHLIHKVRPVLPKLDPRSGVDTVHGDVVVRIFIATSGTVRSIRALSGPNFTLRQAAINSVSLWRYKPFRVGGHPVRVDTTVTVHF